MRSISCKRSTEVIRDPGDKGMSDCVLVLLPGDGARIAEFACSNVCDEESIANERRDCNCGERGSEHLDEETLFARFSAEEPANHR